MDLDENEFTKLKAIPDYYKNCSKMLIEDSQFIVPYFQALQILDDGGKTRYILENMDRDCFCAVVCQQAVGDILLVKAASRKSIVRHETR